MRVCGNCGEEFEGRICSGCGCAAMNFCGFHSGITGGQLRVDPNCRKCVLAAMEAIALAVHPISRMPITEQQLLRFQFLKGREYEELIFEEEAALS
jgi:hypothetical protein